MTAISASAPHKIDTIEEVDRHEEQGSSGTNPLSRSNLAEGTQEDGYEGSQEANQTFMTMNSKEQETHLESSQLLSPQNGNQGVAKK